MNRRVLTLTGLLMLSSCGDFQDVNKMQRDNEKAISEAKMPDAPVIEHIDRPWLLGDLIPAQTQIPAILKVPARLTVKRPIALRDAVLMAGRDTGVAVTLDDDLDNTQPDTHTQLPVSSSPLQVGGMTLPPPPAANFLQNTAATAPSAHWHGIGDWFAYSGTRAGLFEALATRFGVYQKFEHDHVRFYRTETRTFVIPAFGGKPTETSGGVNAMTGTGQNSGGTGGMSGGMGGMSGGMGGMGGSSGGSTGSSTGFTSYSSNTSYDAWKNIQATAQMVSGGAQIIADSSLGRLSARGTPIQLDRLKDWAEGLQRDMLKQVSLELRIYQVKVTNEQNYDWQPQLGFKDAAKVWGFETTPISLIQPQTSDTPFNLGGSILDTATGTTGQFAGTKFVLQALAHLGVVTDQNERTAVTLNNHPAPFNVSTNTTFVCNSNTVLATNAGSSSSLQQCVTSAGITGDITPRVVDNRIMLHVSLNLQTLLGLKDVNKNNTYLQQPQTASSVFESEATLESGNILVLSGYIDNQGQKTKNGVGTADNFLFGGGGDAQTQKQMIFITVRARTL